MKAALLVFAVSFVANAAPRIIGGQEIPRSQRPEVAMVSVDSAKCSGTLIGPRAVLIAAHCASTGKTVQVTFENEMVMGKAVRSPLYPNIDHDLALVVLDEAVRTVQPVSVAASAEFGDAVMLAGFGCQNPSGTITGNLQQGLAMITNANGHDIIAEGAAACFGDSGGPGYVLELGRLAVIGVMSKGNIKDTTYLARLDDEEGQKFLTQVAHDFGVTICGLNTACGKN